MPKLSQTDNILTFKSTLTGMMVPEEKRTWNFHSKDLGYLYQLRVGLSQLRAHKFTHEFLDTPNDTCMCWELNPLITFNSTVPYLMFRDKLMEKINHL